MRLSLSSFVALTTLRLAVRLVNFVVAVAAADVAQSQKRRIP